MATSTRRENRGRHAAAHMRGEGRPADATGTMPSRTGTHLDLDSDFGQQPNAPERPDGVWLWLRYPVFAAITATLLETGTLAGAPLSNPFVPADWQLLRWLVFFVAMILVAIPIFGTIDRGGLRHVGEWATEDRGRHVWSTLMTLAIGIAVAVVAGILFATFGPPQDPGDPRMASICGIVCGAIAIGCIQFRLMGRQVEWAFLLVCLTAGITLQVALPPYTNLVADDRSHLQAALGISYVMDGQFTEGQAVAADSSIDDAPWDEGVVDGTPMEEAFAELFSWDGYNEVVEAIDAEPEAGDYIVVEGFSNVTGGSYVKPNMLGRIPMAMGLWFGRLIGLPPSGQLIASRTANLLLYALVVFVALRTLRSGRLILLLVALFPPIVMLASNLNYDAWMIGFIVLGTARFARIVQDRQPFTVGSTLRVLVPLLLGIAVKAPFFPLLVLPLLAPSECYGRDLSRGRLGLAYGGAILALVLSFLVPLVLTSGASNSDTRAFSDVSVYGQIGYVLDHPLRFVRTMLTWGAGFFTPSAMQWGLFDNFLIHELTESTIYAEYGGPFTWIGSGLLVVGPLVLREAGDRSYRTALLVAGTLVISLAAFWLMAVALYLGYSPVGADTVFGVQYRYLFPLLFPVMLFTLNPPVNLPIRWDVVGGVLVCVLAFLLMGQLAWGVFAWI